jgi:hypothetical protein
MKRLIMFAAIVFAALGLAGIAAADTVGPITFESTQGYTAGQNINGQQGWTNTGLYDATVVSGQALRFTSAKTSGSFGDQTYSPALTQPAGEAPAATHFDASFQIGSELATRQLGLHLSVSPTDPTGSRMSYLRFEDLNNGDINSQGDVANHGNGIYVYFDDATSPSFGTAATFNETYVATLSRSAMHTVRFLINFKTGTVTARQGNADDDVKIYIDGKKVISGTTWEDYYRYDPEQAGNGNVVPLVSKMLFRESGTAATTTGGLLVDNLTVVSN